MQFLNSIGINLQNVSNDTLTVQIIMFIIVTIILLLPIILYKKVNQWHLKRPNIIKIIAGVFLLYFLAARWIPDLYSYFKALSTSEGGEYWNNIFISKIFLLDMCPMMAVFLPIAIIGGKKLSAAKVLAPMAIIGALITLYGQAVWINDYEAPRLFEYIFLGIEPNRLYFMMHLMSAFLGILTLVVAPPFTKKSYLWIFGWLCFWLAYELIVIAIFDIQYNATGLVPNDWLGGQYSKVYEFFPMEFPLIVIFWYAIAVLANYILVLLFPKNTRIFRRNAEKASVPPKNYL